MCLRITELTLIGGDKEGFTEHSVEGHMLLGAAVGS